ncbi:hypothetical protein GGR54DRAFT_436977 [Hypoxylon sp. NC1633]|nr:hypothetical protein GGR54DRAFT_436977 [Hypoxylon sp. NC1633]
MSNLETIPRLQHQPVAVDFVDNRLPEFHPAFSHSRQKYDAGLDRYVSPSSKMQGDQPGPKTLVPVHVDSQDVCGPPEIMLSMRFWERVFPDAMDRFEKTSQEPKHRSDSGYSIRGLDDWDQVYEKLESCRGKYLNDEGLIKKVKKGWRKFTDNIGPLQEAWKLVPDIDYVTPVRGTVEFLMDAVKRASNTRQQVLQGLDKLDSMFGDIELFLVVFPTEKNVLEAGIELVVSILTAVERLIGFYLKPRGKKAISAMFMGDEYEEAVISSLNDVVSKSESLGHEATKADMSQSAKNWRKAKQRHKELIKFQLDLKSGQERIMQNQDSHAQNLSKEYQAGVETIRNDIYSLMVEYERNKEQLHERNAALEREVSDLKTTVQRLTPSPIPTPSWHITPDDLWDIFGPSFETLDIQHILERQEHIVAHERAIAESLVSVPRFREWMVSPTSRELLVQADFTSGRQPSALSVFCSTFLQALRRNEKFIALAHFCGLHADYDDPEAGPRSMMMSFIAQLILQWSFDTSFLHEHVDLSWVEYDDEPDMSDLCALVSWFVHQLPAYTTVFFIIDGVNAYEKERYIQYLTDGLACILDFALDEKIQATVKVLVASPCRTLEVRKGFNDDMILVLAGQHGVNMEASQRQLQHRVSKVLESN